MLGIVKNFPAIPREQPYLFISFNWRKSEKKINFLENNKNISYCCKCCRKFKKSKMAFLQVGFLQNWSLFNKIRLIGAQFGLRLMSGLCHLLPRTLLPLNHSWKSHSFPAKRFPFSFKHHHDHVSRVASSPKWRYLFWGSVWACAPC